MEIINVDSKVFPGNILSVFSLGQSIEGSLEEQSQLKTIEYRFHRFAFNPLNQSYQLLSLWKDENWTNSSIIVLSKGLNTETIEQRKSLFGENQIDIGEKSTFALLLNEILHPFSIFQLASVVLWIIDDYIYYAFTITLLSIITTLISLAETKQSLKKLKEMSVLNGHVMVLRNTVWSEINTKYLVPGDVFEVSIIGSVYCPCDALLLQGDCIANESMLTGESLPVSKMSVSDEDLVDSSIFLPSSSQLPQSSLKNYSKHIIFGGTKIIRTRAGLNKKSGANNAIAMVLRTGFNTEKGNLIRSMLFPKPSNFQLYKDSFKFIGILSIIALVGLFNSTWNLIKLDVGWRIIVIRALDIMTIVKISLHLLNIKFAGYSTSSTCNHVNRYKFCSRTIERL